MDAKSSRDLERLRRTILQERGQRSYDIGKPYEDVLRVLTEAYGALVESTGHAMHRAPEHLSTVAKWLCGQGRCGLLLYGGYGLGKTTTLRAIHYAVRFLNGGYLPHYTAKQVLSMPNEDIKSLRRNERIVMVDELGREQNERRDYGNVSEPVIELIRFREDRGLPTVLASNLLEQEFVSKYDPYIHDRLFGSFSRIFFEGQSYRKL